MIGKTVSHYEITGKLGEGGMGVVYKARDTKLNRDVALKFLPAGLTSDEESRKRFVREAQAAAALNHPNICAVHEIGESDGHTFIVMPCISGAGLAGRLKEGPLPVDEALDIAIQVGKGLSKAHRNDIIHRDIKPGNILITEEGHAKIVDFGLAKLGSLTKMTMVGTTLGTVRYMSPEQARGDEVDHRADIWALGVVLYEMLSGQMPFRGEVDAAVIYSIMNEEPESLADACPECPDEFAKVISTALVKEAADRFQSMDEMVTALEAIRGGKSVPTVKRTAGRAGGRINRRVAIGVIAAVVIAAAILGYRFLGRGQKIESIAVLPITDMSGEQEKGSLADGFTAALINEMSQRIKGIGWTGHRSVMRFRDTEKSPSEIADELDVDALLEGSIIREGENILLTVQLIALNPERQIWSDKFRHRYGDILAMYGEVTAAIAEQVRAAISPEAEAAMAARREVDPKAYENYLYGMYWLNASLSVSMDGDIGTAKRFFDASIAIDSTYAPAWAGLAEVYVMLFHSSDPPENVEELCLVALDKAMELDPNVSDIYRTKTHLLWEHTWDMETAEAAMARGLKLNPSDAYLILIKSIFMMCTGRLEEGARAAKRAAELDPQSYKVNTLVWWPMAKAGWIDEAIAQIDRVAATFPEKFGKGTSQKVRAYALAGDYETSIKLFEESVKDVREDRLSKNLEFDRRYMSRELANYCLLAGHEERAGRLLDEYRNVVDPDTLPPWNAAMYYALRGDNDRAFELLEKVYSNRDWVITRLMSNYAFIPLYDDPRFMDLARRIGVRE